MNKILVFLIAMVTISTQAIDIVSDLAEKRQLPVDSPKYSDVSFTSRWPRDNGFEVSQKYHATRLDWCYINGNRKAAADFVKKFHNAGMKFGAAISQAPQDINGPSGAAGRVKNRRLTLHGKLEPDKDTGFQSGWGAYRLCLNDPDGQKNLIYWHKRALDIGADSFQHDDVLEMANGVPAYCYCKWCMDGFSKYLKRNLSANELKELGISNINKFNYRDFLLNGGKSFKLTILFKQFMNETDSSFFKLLRQEVDKHTGKHIPFSKNNGSRQEWTPTGLLYDYAIGELSDFSSDVVNLNFAALKSIHYNKMQLINCPKGRYSPEQRKSAYRQTIALGYSLGMPVMCPWDLWEFDNELQKKAKAQGKVYYGHRLYPDSKDYADLYKFVRDNSKFFDKYERVAVAGYDSAQKSYLENKKIKSFPPVLVNVSDVFAFVRAIPGNSTAPAVIHLVDTRKKKGSFSITLNPFRFSSTGRIQIEVLRPGLAPLRLGSGGITSLEIPPLSPWGILKITPIETKTSELLPPDIVSPVISAISPDMPLILDNPNKRGVIRFTLDGSTVDSKSQVYSKPVIVEKDIVLKAKVFESQKQSPETIAKFKFSQKFSIGTANDMPPKPDILLSELKIIKRRAVKWHGKEGVNKSLSGGLISINGKSYRNGLSVKSHSELTFQVKPEYKEFTAVAGLEDAAGKNASVSFAVKADEKIIWKSRPVLSDKKRKSYLDSIGEVWSGKNSKCTFIHLRIPEGTKTLTLIVDGSGDGIEDDLGAWVDAGFMIQGLKHHFALDEQSGRCVKDSTGNLKSRNIYGNLDTWKVDGIIGGALHFTGKQGIIIDNAPGLNIGRNDFSVTLWFNRDDLPASKHDNERLLSKLPDDKDKSSGGMEIVAGKKTTGIRIYSGTKDIIKYIASPSSGKWHFLALTIDRKSDVKLYIDGLMVQEDNISGWKSTDISSKQPFCIGARERGQRFKGIIDDICIYNKVLKEPEINDIYQKNKRRK